MRFKALIRKAVNTVGYDLHRLPALEDIALYRSLYPSASLQERRFYNIGAGAFRHPCWTNVDLPSDWYAAAQEGAALLPWNLLALAPLPVEDARAELVYTSHTIEHATDQAAANLFLEAHRILKPRGTLRVTAPNMALDLRAYQECDRSYFYWADWHQRPEEYRARLLVRPLCQASLQQIFLFHFASSASTLHADGAPQRIDDAELDRLFASLPAARAFDHCTARCPLELQHRYPGNHINWWTPEKLVSMLERAGFAQVQISGYGQSRVPVLRNTAFFDSTHPKISLYVEARKG